MCCWSFESNSKNQYTPGFRVATRHHPGLRSISHYVKIRFAFHQIQRNRGNQKNQMHPGTAITRNNAAKIFCDPFVCDSHLNHAVPCQHGKYGAERDIDTTSRAYMCMRTIGQRYHPGLNLKVYPLSS